MNAKWMSTVVSARTVHFPVFFFGLKNCHVVTLCLLIFMFSFSHHIVIGNESCGICLKRNETAFCDPFAICEECGNTVCSVDEYCCNPGCSMCTPVRGSCLPMLCFPSSESDGFDKLLADNNETEIDVSLAT